MLPTTLAFLFATQMSLTQPAIPLPKIEKSCGTRAVWNADTQLCRTLPPTREQCWSDGQQLDPGTRSCVPVTLSAFCREHNWDYEQEHTVSRILNDLNAHDCDEAEAIVLKTRKLSLRSVGVLKVEDIRPLRALPFIEELNLDGQKISDLGPLAKITRLRKLSLINNDVYDLTPLLNLPQLEWVNLSGNPISPQDPVLKKLQKKVRVILQAPAVEAPLAPEGDGPGFIVEPD